MPCTKTRKEKDLIALYYNFFYSSGLCMINLMRPNLKYFPINKKENKKVKKMIRIIIKSFSKQVQNLMKDHHKRHLVYLYGACSRMKFR